MKNNNFISINSIYYNSKNVLEEICVLEKITKKFEDSLHDMLQSAISTAQNKYKSDIFGFGLYYYRYHPDYFKHVQSVWDDDVFPYIKVNIDISINLETKGALNETIQKEEDVRDEKTN